MDINCNIIRKRSTFSSKMNSREPSVISNISTTLYYKRMDTNNNLLDKDIQDLINSSQLFYNNSVEKGNSVRKTAGNHLSRDLQHVQNKVLALKNTSKLQDKSISVNNPNIYPLQDSINIQLPYDINQATKQDL